MAILLVPLATKAQDKYKLLEPLPCIEGTPGCVTENGLRVVKEMPFEDYLGYVFKFAIAISAFLAVIMIIYGGFEIMLSEAIPAKLAGKERIYNALIGLLMVLSSYLILRTIDPRLVEINTTIPKIETAKLIAQMESFNKELASDIARFSLEAQQNIENLQNSNEQKLARISEIETKDGERTNEESVELERLKQEIAQNNNLIQSSVAKQSGSIDYERAVNIMTLKDPTESDLGNLKQYYNPEAEQVRNIPDKNGNLPIDTPNAIQNQYNDKINKVRKTDPQQAQMLANQRDFYIQSVEASYLLNEKVKTHGKAIYSQGSTYSAPQVTGYVDNTKYLQTRLAAEMKNLTSTESAKHYMTTAGVSEDEYKKIVEIRIKQINSVLNKK